MVWIWSFLGHFWCDTSWMKGDCRDSECAYYPHKHVTFGDLQNFPKSASHFFEPRYLHHFILLQEWLLLFRQRRCQSFIVTDNEPVCCIVLTAFDNRDFMRNDIPVIKIFQSGHCAHLPFSARHNTTGVYKSPEKKNRSGK